MAVRQAIVRLFISDKKKKKKANNEHIGQV